MPATNSIPLALSFMEVGCKTNHPYYGSPLLIYINLPRAFAKRRRPSVEAKGGSAILQIVSAAKWRVAELLFTLSSNGFRRWLARHYPHLWIRLFGASTRSAPAQARPPVAARRRSNSWEACGSIVVRSLIYLKTQPGRPYVLWDVGSIRPKGQKNDFRDAEAIAEAVQRPYRHHQSNPRLTSIAAGLLFWGRGPFCGWLCPSGALEELLNNIAQALKVPQFKVPWGLHERLWPIKYIIFLGLFGISLYSTAFAELLAEVELTCARSARRLRLQSLMQLNIRRPAWCILFRICKRGGYHDKAFPIWCRQWSAIGG